MPRSRPDVPIDRFAEVIGSRGLLGHQSFDPVSRMKKLGTDPPRVCQLPSTSSAIRKLNMFLIRQTRFVPMFKNPSWVIRCLSEGRMFQKEHTRVPFMFSPASVQCSSAHEKPLAHPGRTRSQMFLLSDAVAVGTGIAPRPPHGPGRARLTHPVLIAGRMGKDRGSHEHPL
jgi:hypothetical protein